MVHLSFILLTIPRGVFLLLTVGSVFLKIIKIAFLVILALIGLLLLLLILVLAAPIRYRVRGGWTGELLLKGKITWLYKILGVRVQMVEKKPEIKISIFGYTLGSKKNCCKKRKKKKDSESDAAAVSEESALEEALGDDIFQSYEDEEFSGNFDGSSGFTDQESEDADIVAADDPGAHVQIDFSDSKEESVIGGEHTGTVGETAAGCEDTGISGTPDSGGETGGQSAGLDSGEENSVSGIAEGDSEPIFSAMSLDDAADWEENSISPEDELLFEEALDLAGEETGVGKPGLVDRVKAFFRRIRSSIGSLLSRVKSLLPFGKKKEETSGTALAEQTEASDEINADTVAKDGALARVKRIIARGQEFLAVPSVKKLIGKLWKSIRKILKHLMPTDLQIDAKVGMGDPAKTGQLMELAAILYAFYGDHIRIESSFDEEVREGQAELTGRIIPGYLLLKAAGMGLRIILNKECRRLYKEIRA